MATHKNMADGSEQENVEEGATALGSDARTVRQLTGEVCKVFTLLSRFSLITIELEPDILYIEGVLNDNCDVL